MHDFEAVNLVGESFSPWTKKARWALEYAGLDYQYQEYIPTLSELKLRWRLRQWSGSISVPVLFVGQSVYRGSWEIANYANRTGDGARLGNMREIKYWDDLSEDALAEGRTRVVRSILNNNQALEESLPAWIPKMLRRPMRFLARDAARRLDHKYAHLLTAGSLESALESIRRGLDSSPSEYLFGQFSYADTPMGIETTKIWNDVALTSAYSDLIKWRDSLAANPKTAYSQFNCGGRKIIRNK